MGERESLTVNDKDLISVFLKIIRAPSSGEAAEKVPFPCIAIIFMQNSDVSIGFRDLSKSHFVHKN